MNSTEIRNDKNTNLEEIKKSIFEYIKNDNDVQAILIDGPWGSGKTFFVKHSLIKMLNEESENSRSEIKGRKTFYLSLYGTNSIKQINDVLITTILSQYKFKGDWIFRIVNGLIKGISLGKKEIIADLDLNSIIMNAAKVISDRKIEKQILIFDDFERSSVPINDLVGLINDFAEHKRCKVIIIANKEEIGNASLYQNLPEKLSVIINNKENIKFVMDNDKNLKHSTERSESIEKLLKYTEEVFSEKKRFEKISEKIIGTTFYFHPSIEDVYDTMASAISAENQELWSLYKNYKDKIIRLYEEEECSNLRTLFFTLERFCYLYHKIVEKIKPSDGMNLGEKIPIEINKVEKYQEAIDQELGELLYSCACSGLTVKNCKKFSKEEESCLPPNYFFDRAFRGISPEYYCFLEKFLQRYEINDSEMIIDLKEKIKERFFDNIDPYTHFHLLKFWFKRADTETYRNISFLQKELTENLYSFNKYPEIADLLITLKNEGFTVELKEFQIIMGKNISSKVDQICKENLQTNYIIENRDEVIEFMKPLLEIIDNNIKQKEDQVLNNFFSSKDKWINDWKKFWVEHKKIIEEKGAFLSLFELSNLQNFLQGCSPEELNSFYKFIDHVYKNSNTSIVFINDEQALKDFNEMVEKIYTNEKGISRKSNLNLLRKKIDEIINLMNNNNPSNSEHNSSEKDSSEILSD